MSADPVAAGRKGGSRNTPAQQEARRKNGFQRREPTPAPSENEQRCEPASQPVLIPNKANQEKQ
jgi:hypothetical protein